MLLNHERAHSVMREHGVDVLVAASQENLVYVADFWSLNQSLGLSDNFAILPSKEDLDPTLVTPLTDIMSYISSVNKPPKKIQCYSSFTGTGYTHEMFENPTYELTNTEQRLAKLVSERLKVSDGIQALVKVLELKGLTKCSIGIDEQALNYTTTLEIKRLLPSSKIMSASDIFREIRSVKTEEEVERLGQVVAITERAIEALMGVVREGLTDRDLALEFAKSAASEGALPYWVIVGVGRRGVLPGLHVPEFPSSKPIQRGDVIKLDVGCQCKHYLSDIARTLVVGNPSTKLKRYYNALLAGFKAMMNAIEPGIRASEVFAVGMKKVRESGIPHYERTHLGHGIGLESYEQPIIAPDNNIVLHEGMVMSLETPYIELGWAGLNIEDVVVVCEEGARSLNTLSHELFIV